MSRGAGATPNDDVVVFADLLTPVIVIISATPEQTTESGRVVWVVPRARFTLVAVCSGVRSQDLYTVTHGHALVAPHRATAPAPAAGLLERFDAALLSTDAAASDNVGLLPDALAMACAEVLPVAAAGISLICDDNVIPLGASDGPASLAGRLQLSSGEGPCRQAYRQSYPLRASGPDLQQRWPGFYTKMRDQTPYRSIVSLPLTRLGQGWGGAVDLYLDHPTKAYTLGMQHAARVGDRIASTLRVWPPTGESDTPVARQPPRTRAAPAQRGCGIGQPSGSSPRTPTSAQPRRMRCCSPTLPAGKCLPSRSRTTSWTAASRWSGCGAQGPEQAGTPVGSGARATRAAAGPIPPRDPKDLADIPKTQDEGHFYAVSLGSRGRRWDLGTRVGAAAGRSRLR